MTHTPNGEREAAEVIERVRNAIESHRKGLSDDWQDFIAEQVRDLSRAIALLQSPAAVQQGEASVSTLPDLYWHITRNALRDGSPFAVACMGALPALNAALAPSRQAGGEAIVEACAKKCDERAAYYAAGDDDGHEGRRASACRACAAVIRYHAGTLAAAPTATDEGKA